MTIHAKLAVAALAGTLFMGQAAFAQTTLTMSSWVPPVHPLMADVLIPWAKSIETVTHGRVKVRILPKSVGAPPQQFEVISTDQADIGYSNQSYTAGLFRNYAFSELPRSGDDAVATSVAYWRVYKKFLSNPDEMADVKLLGLFTHGPGQIFTKDHTIAGMDGNEGIKIRAGGEASARVIDALGMTSVQAPISQAAEMINNGIVNGIALEAGSVPIFGFDSYLNNSFTVTGGLYNTSFFVAMNLDKWNALSPEDQAAIESVSGEALARKAGEMWNTITAKGEQGMTDAGYVKTKPEGDFAAALDAKFDAFDQAWIASVAENGIDGRAVLDAYHAEIAKLEGK